MSTVLAALATSIAAVLLGCVGYLIALTLAALFARPRLPAAGPVRRRFAILVAAHTEAALIARLLQNLGRLDYPAGRRDVFVVADNCDDATAAVARSLGALVYERSGPVSR